MLVGEIADSPSRVPVDFVAGWVDECEWRGLVPSPTAPRLPIALGSPADGLRPDFSARLEQSIDQLVRVMVEALR